MVFHDYFTSLLCYYFDFKWFYNSLNWEKLMYDYIITDILFYRLSSYFRLLSGYYMNVQNTRRFFSRMCVHLYTHSSKDLLML